MGNSFSESQVCRCSSVQGSKCPKTQGAMGVGKLVASDSQNFNREEKALQSQLSTSQGLKGTTSLRLPVNNVTSTKSEQGETSKGNVQIQGTKVGQNVQTPINGKNNGSKGKGETNLPKLDGFVKTGASGGKRSERKVRGQSPKSQLPNTLLGDMKGLTLLDNEILEDKTQTKASETNLPVNVLYYGWFFSVDTSTVVREVVMNIFQLCYKEVSQFERFMTTCCAEADVRDPFQYYKRPNKRAKPTDDITYHLTAKFLGRLPDEPYQLLVDPFLQKTFRIHLIGIVFTSKTLGVRVQLTPAQQLIFDEKDEHRTGKSVQVAEHNENIQMQLIGERKSYKKNTKTNTKCKLKSHDVSKSSILYKPLHPITSSPSRAHLTIGCAPKVAAKQTGDDLIDIIDLEGRSQTCGANFHQDFNLKHGVLRQFGRHANAFVFYPNMEMIIPGEFNHFI